MDITHLFKAGVMSVKLQQKSKENPIVPDKKRILKTSKTNGTKKESGDDFPKQVKDVCAKITDLRNLLLENRKAYMKIGQHLKRASSMTDEQRDIIDRESEKFITYYTQHIAQMRSDWKHVKRKPQQVVHMEAVFEILLDYLRSVQQIYLEQKQYRALHELETYRLLKLASNKKKIPVSLGDKVSTNRMQNTENVNAKARALANISLSSFGVDISKDNQSDRDTGNNSSVEDVNDDSSLDSLNTSGSLISKSQQAVIDDYIQITQQLDEAEAKELNPEDVQMFEEENDQMYSELQGLSEEVDQIEKNVVDIAHLQDIFTEKVSMQQHNIERIANAVIGATENVKDANEQIKQAIQRNAGLRVWSLFFLLVMSFALLFLDWYYD